MQRRDRFRTIANRKILHQILYQTAVSDANLASIGRFELLSSGDSPHQMPHYPFTDCPLAAVAADRWQSKRRKASSVTTAAITAD